ncbi:PAS domain-containing sensor histidine kinase [Rhodoplanes sp. Z2-YC6860]|uniref:PAS domain-containing sensor histidine kinase n=1 Tax=Rhodoplanes sp. Z2-YC6860 TaxID=674703 RepID=UPI000832D64F|nr:PAS domain-containing protein [Rhodoplanes sp. Z2-YC6860]
MSVARRAAGEAGLAPPELRWIYDTAPIGLAFLSPDCQYLQINQRLTDICGISVEGHLGHTVREMVPNIAGQVEQLVRSIVESGKPITGIEVNGQRADGVGADRAWLTNWYPLKGPGGRVVGVNVAAEEITERKRAQAAVIASEQRYRALAQATSSLVLTATLDGQFIESPGWCAFTGQSPDEIRGSGWLAAVHPGDRDRARDVWQRSVRQKSPFEVEYRIRQHDGVHIWHQVRANAVLENNGTVREWVGICVDIDNKKQTAERRESDLHRTETYLAEAEKLSHTGFWSRKTKTGEIFWSPEEWNIFAIDPAVTTPSLDLVRERVHPEDRALFDEASARAIREKRPYDISYRVVLHDGTVKNIHTVCSLVLDETGEVAELVGATIDETERVRATAALQEAQAELARVARLTTMGELAASIAHEINQPLAAVVANGNAALRWLDRATPDLAEAKDALEGAIQEGNRASEVIGRIRAFLRNRKPDYVATDINEAIREVLALTMNTLRQRNVIVKTSLPSEVPPVLGDRVQLQQVIMNLVINGADAMNSVTDRSRVLRIGSQLDGTDNVLVVVGDTGTGIDEAVKNRVFDPLFTTKSTGMGMGLPICRGIVQSHGGRLWAAPAKAHGTEFCFTLPVAPG